MTDTRRRALITSLIVLAAVSCTTHASAVTDQIASPDSLETHLQILDSPFGAGTSWMIGMTLLEQGDLAGALPYLAQAWRMSPEEVELGQVYRDVLLELGYARDALEVSRSVLAVQPGDLHTQEQHIVIQATLESFDEALAGLDVLNVDHPDSVRLDRLKGEILVRARRWPEARDHFRNLLEQKPEDVERITATLAEILILLGDHDEAASVWRTSVAAHPESRALRIGSIQFDVSRGRDQEAFAAAGEAERATVSTEDDQQMDWITLTAGMIAGTGRIEVVRSTLLEMADSSTLSLDATLFLVRILDNTDERGRAIGLLRDAIARWPDEPRPRVYLGEFLAMGGDLVAAEQSVREALVLAPEQLDSRFSLISILSRRYPEAYNSDRDVAAQTVREEIITIARDLADRADEITDPSRLMLGAAFHGMGLHEEAIPHFEAAAQNPDFIRDALLNLSVVYDDLDRPERVREVLERLHEALPSDAVAQNALGYTLADQNIDLERAEALIRFALAADPENPAYLDSLGWVLHRRGQDMEAFDFLVQAANAQPEDPVILEHLARILMGLGQVDRAYGVAQQALAAGGDPAHLIDILPGGDGP